MKNKWRKSVSILGVLLLPMVLPGLGKAAVQTKIYQCANYKAGTGDHNICEDWINGNINEQKATYFEGDSVPYRLHITGLTPGDSYTATIEWDATQGDKNALDYITNVNRTVLNADPCQDLTISGGCNANSPASTWLIPIDTEMEKGRDQTASTADDITQPTPEYFRMWNATITATGSYVYDPTPWDYMSTTKISIPITFTAGASDVLLAWGGHISTRMDWGNENSAINISGSPYHMRLLTVVHVADNDIVASGNRDLQLSASAVFFPFSLTIEKDTDSDTSDYFDFTTNLISPDDTFSLQSCIQSSSNCTKTLTINQAMTVEVSETDPGSLWDLDSITCIDLTDDSTVSFTPINSGTGASLDLAEGATVKCTFYNVFTGLPMLAVEKKVIETDAECDSVNFDDPTTNELLEIASGDTVKYCYRVKNTGTAPAYNVTLTDDAAGLSAPFNVPLSGGDIANLDGGGTANDLDIDSATYGEKLVTINEQTGSEVINTATADADNADAVDDTAEVDVVDEADCTLTATVTTTTCPGSSNTIDVTSGTGVTWCAEICWPSNANSALTVDLSLLDGNSDPLDPPVSTNDIVIATGSCETASFPESLGLDSVQRILAAAGQDGFGNDETCQASAAANVYNPDINVEKKVSLDNVCGNSDDTDSAEVYTGTDVWYCFTVTNNGDEDLTNVQFSDPTLGESYTIGNLAAGTSWNSSAYGPYTRTSEISNTGSVCGDGASTATHVCDDDTAIVTVVSADIVVEKTGTTSLDLTQGESDIQYQIFVWNAGNTTAKSVDLTDYLPEPFLYASDDSGCSYEDNDAISGGGSLTCSLGDIEPGMANGVTINVYGSLVPETGYLSFDNEACAYPDNNETPDVDISNNCDTTTTRTSNGATRTIGFWGNHPDMMEQCLAANENLIDELGFVELATVENAIGIIKTNIAHDVCMTKRDDLTKARLQAGRQVLAAFCNVTYLGASTPSWLATATTVLSGDDIQAILELSGLADEFNNSGDEEALPAGINPEPADPHFAWTDPTSPSYCATSTKGKGKGKNKSLAGEGSGGGGGCALGNGKDPDPMLPLLFVASVLIALLRRKAKA